jgi:hypothetical protein
MKKRLGTIICKISSLFVVMFFSGTMFSVFWQYYYFDTATTTYPLQQWCQEDVFVRINTEWNTYWARVWLLRLLFDNNRFGYNKSALASVLRTNLFVPSSATFSDWSSEWSPSWENVDNTILQLDRKNNLTDYRWNGGTYGTVKLQPNYSQTSYTWFISIIYDWDTTKTSLSRVWWVNIINPVSQNSRLTWMLPVVQAPCVMDDYAWLISVSTPNNWATKQFSSSWIVLGLTDDSSNWSVPYVWTGWWLWTGNIWSITNQYGIDLNSFTISINWNWNSRTFVWSSFDTWNVNATRYALPSGKTWQFLDKNYNIKIASWELFDYGIEKPITLTSSVRDRNNNIYTLWSFVFNQPVGPWLLWSLSPASNAVFIDPLAPVKLWIQDDRAGVNTGSIRVTLQWINGTVYWPYVLSGSSLNITTVAW